MAPADTEKAERQEPPTSSTRGSAALPPAGPPCAPRRLEDVVRSLPAAELQALIARVGIRVDPAKRIDAPSQVARALAGQPDARDPVRLPAASRELLHRIAEAGGLLVVPSVPAGLEPLLARGMVYGRRIAAGEIELVLPTAFLLQLRSWESEDPRALRALVAQAPFETQSAIASHYLGRPATPPIPLSLECAWGVLADPDLLRAETERLAPVERRLLEAIEAVGGEVDTQELLDLEREPMRLRGAGGVTPSRRGVGFALERRAFLIPIHPGRHVIPTEVAAIVGAERQHVREQRRAEIRSFVVEEDHAPRRARFALDPAPFALGLAIAIREPGSDVRPGVGTPRSLLVRLGQRFGRDPEATGLIAALSRAIGLWEPSAVSAVTPPGALTLLELTRALFATWRRGGAWDEARPEREVFRVSSDARDASPIGALRDMVLEALVDLGEGRWVPWDALEGYLAADARIPSVARLLRRWAERAAVEAPDPLEVARRIALETLPTLGIVDLGGEAVDASSRGLALRLTPRGRLVLTEAAASAGGPAGSEGPISGRWPTSEAPGAQPSKFVDTHVLRVGSGATAAHVLALGAYAELGRLGDQLDLVLTAPSIGRAISAGVDGEILRRRIEAVAPLPDTMSKMLVQVSAIVGRATWVASSGFLWVEDGDVRELLRTRRPACELFVDPSPPGGLLIAPDVDADRLVRRCRALGVEIEVEAGGVLRAGASRPTMPATGAPPSSRTPSRPSQPASVAPSSRSGASSRQRTKTSLPRR